VWVGLCELDLERTWFPRVGLGWLVEAGQRSAFNPLVELADRPVWAYGFLAIRFVGLAAMVPLAEELFLRGFVTRFVDNPDWPGLPIGQFSWTSALGTTAIAMLAHPAELLAAAVWFSLVSVMVSRTRRLWDAVAAHAVTNLLLGVYVVQSGAWRLL
jgi:CAAX prenyl protease-like protein